MKKILFVDDEPNVLAAFQRQLRKQFDLVTAEGPAAGLAALQNGHEFDHVRRFILRGGSLPWFIRLSIFSSINFSRAS